MMAWSFILGLILLLIPLAYLLASLVGLSYLWYRVFKGRSGGDLPTCAKCGYAVRGLMGLDCPECGADLREVGIITSKQRGAVSPVMFVLLWTMFLPGPSCLVFGLLVSVGPKTSVPNDMLELTPIVSGQYLSANIHHTNIYPFGGTVYTSLSVEGNASQDEYMGIDPAAMTYEDWPSVTNTTTSTSSTSTTSAINTGSLTKPLDSQAMLAMLKRAGADITRQDVMDEADELLSIIRGMPTQGLANLNPTHFTQSYHNLAYDQPAWGFMGAILGLWVLVWIGGFWVYFRIQRKQQPNRAEPIGQAPSSQTAD